MSRAPNYEFQEWWNEQREKNQELFTNDTNNLSNGFLTVEISSPNLDRTAEKDRARSARQLSWVCLFRFQQLANSLAWITNAFILLLGTANRRISSSDSSSSRLYRIIKFFLFLVLLLLCVELVAYFKGWHFSPPSAALAEAAVELVYAKWLEIRADYLAPPLQSLANLCIVLFLIQSVYRVVLMLGCFWIKFRSVKPTVAMEYPVGRVEGENVEDYPMVLVQIPMCNEREVSEANGESNEKLCKSTESNGNENGFVKAEEDAKLGSNGNAGDEKQNKTKPPEPHKDYIHVRARRGQATDSHSLAERVRREQISERMKLLQDLVPGCNKVTGKALMLDEIINYVQSLQRQVEFLSVQLTSVNTRLDFNIYNLMSKEDRSELANSQEESTVSEQNPNGDPGFKASKDSNSRKREAVPKAKTKETSASPSANAAKVSEANGESNEKRCRSTESNGNENGFVKAEEDTKLGSNGNAGDEKQNKTKPPEPHKDYIHVRARRGQATDSHSLAERVRREKISERMKLLQDLVPGCNKVTGKALMLDEIINYVQSLQRQVEFLSMKLASVNTRLDFNVDNVMSKEIFQSNNTVLHPIFPIDSSASALFGHQPRQNPALHSNISNGTMTQCSVDPLDAVICPNLNTHLPPINQFTETAPQYPTLCEGDLQTIVQMGFGQNPSQEMTLQSENLLGSNQVSHMKAEL